MVRVSGSDGAFQIEHFCSGSWNATARGIPHCTQRPPKEAFPVADRNYADAPPAAWCAQRPFRTVGLSFAVYSLDITQEEIEQFQ